MIRDPVLKNRSYHRWHQDEIIEYETVKEFVDLARLCSSAANRQALKYIISNDPKKNALIFGRKPMLFYGTIIAEAAHLKCDRFCYRST